MKQMTMMLQLLTFFLLFSACSPAETRHNKPDPVVIIDPGKALPGKVLIVYVSRTNNTKAIAEIIHKQVGGTLVALELATPYPENYRATVEQVARENESGFLPVLKTKINNIQQYDVVFVGFPTWGMQLPPPMKSFLRQHDLNRKTVIPFNTNGGYGIGSAFQTVKELCPNSQVLDGFTTRGGSERDGQLLVITGEKGKEAETNVQQWLRKIKMI